MPTLITPTVAFSWVHGILDAAAMQGVPQRHLADLAGVPVTSPAHGRLPIDQVVRLWRLAAELSGDALFGLHMGEHIKPASFNVVAFTLLSAANLRAAIRHMQRYQRLISDAARLQLLEGDEISWLVYHPQPGVLAFSPHQVEAALATVLTAGRWILNRPLVPLQVRFRHTALGSSSEYRRVLGCDPGFEASFDGIALSTAQLEQALPAADPMLFQLHQRFAEQHLSNLDQHEPWASRTRYALMACLAQGVLDREAVAAAMGLTGKQLQHRLAQEQASFSAVLDMARRDLALEWVKQRTEPLAALADRLGFAEQSVFNRAFRRWTGLTPGAYRDQSRSLADES
ncbi:AraC-like DNA-binding protein [Chitinivorax tropicus]|uniref:AraC-like DNA-binding protein n=1 Tax=Chitinivorax tropicus TaxID=714531 RepID=A0A840MHU7_9PROT|nr:AraC family transcriptional regulator [Chitinivorax tropicus]MBB5017970.1 AraC-like DNA-binding protein [Chitinivorax tropicus]